MEADESKTPQTSNNTTSNTNNNTSTNTKPNIPTLSIPSPNSISPSPMHSPVISSPSSAPPPSGAIDPDSPYYREYHLLMEFKHLPEKIGNGIYAMPSFESLYIWHCAIFIRQGVYRGGIFRFSLTIPSTYPNAPPDVRFFTPIFHPLIGTDGSFDISREFPDWTSRRHFLFTVLAYVKKVFYHLDLCTTRPPLNPEAFALYSSNTQAFITKAEECVKKSTENVYDNPEGSSIKFSPYTKEMDSMRDSILKDKNDTLFSWVSKSVSKSVSSIISFKY